MSENLENRISSEQAKDAIYKASQISSSASEIDGSVKLNNSNHPTVGNTLYNVENDRYFFDLTGWVITNRGSGTPIIENSTEYVKFNKKSLKLANNTSGVQGTRTDMNKILSTPLDLSEHDLFTFWVYIPEEPVANGFYSADWGEIRFYFTNLSNTEGLGVKFGSLNISFQVGWNNITLPKTLFNIPIGVGQLNWANVERVRLQYFAGIGNYGTPCYLDSLIVGGGKSEKVPFVMTLDDSTVDTFYMGEILNEYGIPYSTFVIPSLIENQNATGYIRKHQLKIQYDRGNHVGIHNTGLNDFAINPNNILVVRDWLKENGFTRDDGHLYGTYPNGTYSEATIDLLKSSDIKGFRQVYQRQRNDNESTQTSKGKLPYENVFNGGISEPLKVSGFRPATVAEFKQKLDEAISLKACFLPYFHLFSEVGSRANWIEICKYIKTKVDEGLIECLTFPQFCKKYS